MQWAVRAYPYIQYDGSNADDVLKFLIEQGLDPTATGSVIKGPNQDPNVIQFDIQSDQNGPGTYIMAQGDWVSPTVGVITPVDWAEQFIMGGTQ